MTLYIWYIIRATGTIAYILMYVTVLSGIYSQYAKKKKKINNVLFLHEKLSDWTLILTIFHVSLLFLDSYVSLTWLEILIAFQTDYKPIGTATGIVGLYFLGFTMITSKAKKIIGHQVWKKLHGLNPLLYVLVTIHGIFLGTDTHAAFYIALNMIPFLLIIMSLVKKQAIQPSV